MLSITIIKTQIVLSAGQKSIVNHTVYRKQQTAG